MMQATRPLLLAIALLGGVLLNGSAAHARNAGPSYNDPLVFGMTPQEVEQTVQAPLIHLSGRRGNERYLIERMSTVPGIYPVDTRIVLQFRRGRLTGWRRDWQMRPYWF
jgi:hypothetical protein